MIYLDDYIVIYHFWDNDYIVMWWNPEYLNPSDAINQVKTIGASIKTIQLPYPRAIVSRRSIIEGW